MSSPVDVEPEFLVMDGDCPVEVQLSAGEAKVLSDCCQVRITPWGCIEDVRCRLSDAENVGYSDLDLLLALTWATEVLDAKTFGTFGMKTFRGMPCAAPCVCRCNPCNCCAYDTLELLHRNVCQLDRVVINCQEQPLSNYRIDKDNTGCTNLVRLDDHWPTQQCWAIGFCDDPALASEECDPYSWWVEYTYGNPVPFGGQIAAAVLAKQYLYLCDGSSKCELPANTEQVVRQGVTTRQRAVLHANRTGVREVDFWLDCVNPNSLTASACLLSPRLGGTLDCDRHGGVPCRSLKNTSRRWVIAEAC